MAALMPDLMLPEVMSLNSYLYHDVSGYISNYIYEVKNVIFK